MTPSVVLGAGLGGPDHMTPCDSNVEDYTEGPGGRGSVRVRNDYCDHVTDHMTCIVDHVTRKSCVQKLICAGKCPPQSKMPLRTAPRVPRCSFLFASHVRGIPPSPRRCAERGKGGLLPGR